MLDMQRDLIAHKGAANVAILNAVRQNNSAASDPELWALLHHTLLANRFWLLTILALPFAVEEESRPSSSLEDLVQRYGTSHEQESVWLQTATEADLERVLESPLIPGGRCSVAQGLMQVCMHSHGHRAQCAKLLRQQGAEPASTDFILWLANRPRSGNGRESLTWNRGTSE